jgi:hypothetical protein
MDNSESDLRQWVVEQTAYLDPPAEWQPDAEAALRRMHHRMRPPKRNWGWAIAAAVPIAAFLLFSAGRMAAQLWQSLTVKQVAVIQVNSWPEGAPSPAIRTLGVPIPLPARDAGEAAWRVKYQPRLPHAGVLASQPKLYTTFSAGAGTVIHTADLELALNKVGIADQTVPASWDGAQIALHTSALVLAQWPDVVLVQSLPLTLSAPPGFDFPAFSALILRILGVAPDEARRLAELTGTTPPWLAPLDRDFAQSLGTLQEIKLNSGPATLLGDKDKVSILWLVPDRVYLLSGNISRELAIAMANAVQ